MKERKILNTRKVKTMYYTKEQKMEKMSCTMSWFEPSVLNGDCDYLEVNCEIKRAAHINRVYDVEEDFSRGILIDHGFGDVWVRIPIPEEVNIQIFRTAEGEITSPLQDWIDSQIHSLEQQDYALREKIGIEKESVEKAYAK